MTAHIPTPEQFLSFPSDPDEDIDDLDPIADLERRVAALEARTLPELPDMSTPEAEDVRVELARKVTNLQALIDEVLAAVKPSTSKLANKVREILQPTQTPSPAPDASPSEPPAPPASPAADEGDRHGQASAGEGSAIVPAAVRCAQCDRYFTDVVALQAHGTRAHGADFDYRDAPVGEHPPARDADVEEWRAYARQRGVYVTGLDTMNRSQIRTMLGIEQPVEAG